MRKILAENILDEGFNVLREHLGAIKTTIFLEMVGKGSGDSLKEIEAKTRGFSREEALEFIKRQKKKKSALWEKIKVA